MAAMIWLRRIGIVLACVAVLAIVAWLLRAPIAETLIGLYFKEQGIASEVTISRLEWSGLAGRFALGDARAPTVSADDVEAVFDDSGWLPRLIALRVVHPVVRARVDADGTVTLPDLQAWIDRITSGPAGHSRFVSDALVVDLQDLRAIVTAPGGLLDLGGQARIERGALSWADVTAQPTVLSRNGQLLRVAGAHMVARALPAGLSVHAQFAGSLNHDASRPTLRAEGVKAVLSASGIRWDGRSASATAAQIRITAQDLRADAAHVIVPDVQATLANIRTSPAGAWQADIRGQATARTAPSDMQRRFARIPVAGADRALGDAFTTATQAMTLSVAGHAHGGGSAFGMQLAAPATLAGRDGA
ncbi:MAG: hypothetical protein ACTHLR_06250, partial [Rhizomicrobium sp.]